MRRVAWHGAVAVVLTVLTQVGGLAWLLALRSRWRLPAFVAIYTAFTVAALWLAPLAGRVPLTCGGDGPLRVQGWFFCAANRNYVVPELAAVLSDVADGVDDAFPGTQTLVLDAGFPFLTGFPLIPHLSHDDGRKADIAFYYADADGYLPGRTRSPVGYFAFTPGPSTCPPAFPTLRWSLPVLQPLWPDWQPDDARMRAVLNLLMADDRVGKVLLEPHLQDRFGVSGGKVRFQGCRAARHDDHIHVQL